jgi:hypothetical protein
MDNEGRHRRCTSSVSIRVNAEKVKE